MNLSPQPKTKKTKRIFVSLTISQSLRSKILRWEKNFSRLPVRWLAGKNLHITLIPPFYRQDIKPTIEKLKSIKNFSGKFEIGFNKVSFGPDPKHPRLIWASGDAPGELINLKKNLEKILGIPSARRPFVLHLTLARFRPENFHLFPLKKLEEKVQWKEKIKSIALFEVKLSSKGAEYNVLEEIKFKL